MSNFFKIQALFISSALLMFGGGLQGLLLSVRGAEEGFSTLALGLIGTGWSVGFIAGSIAVPSLVRRVGHIRSYAVMAAVGTITILLNLLWINDLGWIFLRVFSGFCFSGAAMIVESWLNEVTENKNRGTVFSVYVMINMAASTIGQFSMSVTGVQGYLPFVVGALALICAVLPIAMSTKPQPRPLVSAKLNLPLLFRTSPIAVVSSLCVGMANGSFGTLAPVFGFLKGLTTGEIALLMSVPLLIGAVAQVPFGRMSDFVDRRWVIIVTSSLAALAGLALALINPSGWLLYVLFGVYGFMAFPIHAVAVAHANDFAAEGDFGSVAAGMLLTLGVGLAIGPLISAFVMNALQPVSMFLVTCVVHAFLALSAFIRMKLRPIDTADERSPFRPVSVDKTSTPATITLDPRSDDET